MLLSSRSAQTSTREALETAASNGRGENSVRAVKEMVQRQKESINTLGMRRSDWFLNHLVRNHVVKTSPYESHTGNPAPRSTSQLNRILVGRRDDDDKQPRVQQPWFLGLTGASSEVIALHPDGAQRHHGEWRVSPLDDLESNLRELKDGIRLEDWELLG